MISGKNDEMKQGTWHDIVAAGAITTKRIFSEISAHENELPSNTRAFLECDTNANTCCLGKNFIDS